MKDVFEPFTDTMYMGPYLFLGWQAPKYLYAFKIMSFCNTLAFVLFLFLHTFDMFTVFITFCEENTNKLFKK